MSGDKDVQGGNNVAAFDNPLTLEFASDRYTFLMRRLLAITLLIAFFAPAAAPWLTALATDSEAGLPACCRSHGAHHCAMLHWMFQHADSGAPNFTSGPCAQFPVTATIPQLATFALTPPPRLASQFRPAAVASVASFRAPRRLAASALKTRGPPRFLA
jgi:hypothetical protein